MYMEIVSLHIHNIGYVGHKDGEASWKKTDYAQPDNSSIFGQF